MSTIVKSVEDLVPSDFSISPVWEFALDLEGEDDMLMRPVMKLPVDDLGNRLVGTQVQLANGTKMFADLSCVELNKPWKNQHVLAISVFYGGKWFHLSRYYEVDRDRNGPAALASFLGLPVNEIFPITYDISDCCVGDPAVLRGAIEEEPKQRLSMDEIINLAVRG